MSVTGAKLIGAGLATIGLSGPGVGAEIIFIRFINLMTKIFYYFNEKFFSNYFFYFITYVKVIFWDYPIPYTFISTIFTFLGFYLLEYIRNRIVFYLFQSSQHIHLNALLTNNYYSTAWYLSLIINNIILINISYNIFLNILFINYPYILNDILIGIICGHTSGIIYLFTLFYYEKVCYNEYLTYTKKITNFNLFSRSFKTTRILYTGEGQLPDSIKPKISFFKHLSLDIGIKLISHNYKSIGVFGGFISLGLYSYIVSKNGGDTSLLTNQDITQPVLIRNPYLDILRAPLVFTGLGAAKVLADKSLMLQKKGLSSPKK
jgi:hypothetical protein